MITSHENYDNLSCFMINIALSPCEQGSMFSYYKTCSNWTCYLEDHIRIAFESKMIYVNPSIVHDVQYMYMIMY